MMILTTTFAMAMIMAAPKADPVNNARKALNNCLVELHNKAVSDKVSEGDFDKNLNTGCTAEKDTYRNLIVKAELGFGSKKAEAEKYADEEAQAVVDYIKTAFADNVKSGAQLQNEK
jgi:hypothetical protein